MNSLFFLNNDDQSLSIQYNCQTDDDLLDNFDSYKSKFERWQLFNCKYYLLKIIVLK